VPLVVRLDPELETGLRALSEDEGIPQAELVRRLIREHLAHRSRRRSAFAIAEQLGIIGMDDDPRVDVAKQHSSYVRKTVRAKRSM
jgi:Ribbon-helix-helix protein, copG family